MPCFDGFSQKKRFVESVFVQTRVAAVGDGLVERLEVFERRVRLVRRGLAEMFVQPTMASESFNLRRSISSTVR